MPMHVIQCMSCRHFQRGTGWTCVAFPDGIPPDVKDNAVDHRQPLPGDHGIQWERDPASVFGNPFVDEAP